MVRYIAFILASCLASMFVVNTSFGWYCSEPSKPDIPNGYWAEGYQMEQAKNEVEEYLNYIEDYIQCLKQNIRNVQSEAEGVIEEWNSSVHQYNSK